METSSTTLDAKIESVRADVAGIRTDIKELTEAFRDLIRLDGDIKRMGDAVGRIGRQVDSHDERIRDMEASGIEARTKIGVGSSAASAVIGIVSAIVASLLVHLVIN